MPMAFDLENFSFKSRKDDRVKSLHQVDPAFYRKIVSRSSSMDSSRWNSFHLSPGNVPFVWETEPGEPINSPTPRIERVPHPPGVPVDHHDCLNRPRAVPSSRVHKSKLALVRAKANFSRNMKTAVDIIRNNIRFGQRVEKVEKVAHIFVKKIKEKNTPGTKRNNFEANHNFTPSFPSGQKVTSSSFITCYRMTIEVNVAEGRPSDYAVKY